MVRQRLHMSKLQRRQSSGSSGSIVRDELSSMILLLQPRPPGVMINAPDAAATFSRPLMYIGISWTPIGDTPGHLVRADIERALDPKDFALVYAPFDGLHLAAVRGANLQRVSNLAQTLIPLADDRFDFIITYAPKGHYMFLTDPNLDTDQCRALARY